jgi:hypothetical protein
MSVAAVGYGGNRYTIQRSVSELMYAYERYLRPQLLKLQEESLDIMNTDLSSTESWLIMMTWPTLLPMFIILFMFLTQNIVNRESNTRKLY